MSTNELDDARKNRMHIVKREARDRWVSCLSIDIGMTWPSGFLGWVCAVVLAIAPVGLVILLLRRKRIDKAPAPHLWWEE